jgi:spore coat protein A
VKRVSRRRVLQQGGLLAGGVALGGVRALAQQEAHMGMQMPAPAAGQVRPKKTKTLDAMKLASFVDALVLPQVMKPEGRRSSEMLGAMDAPYYRVPIRMVERKMHRDLPGSKQWSYGDGPGPVLFEAKCGEGVLIDWVNELPAKHFLPLD